MADENDTSGDSHGKAAPKARARRPGQGTPAKKAGGTPAKARARSRRRSTKKAAAAKGPKKAAKTATKAAAKKTTRKSTKKAAPAKSARAAAKADAPAKQAADEAGAATDPTPPTASGTRSAGGAAAKAEKKKTKAGKTAAGGTQAPAPGKAADDTKASAKEAKAAAKEAKAEKKRTKAGKTAAGTTASGSKAAAKEAKAEKKKTKAGEKSAAGKTASGDKAKKKRKKKKARGKSRKSRRAVLVAGLRTPFVKAFGALMSMDTIALGDAATQALLERTRIAPDAIDGIVWGGVILPSGAPNVGREIALDLKLPPKVEGMTVTRACASGLQAVTLAAAAIERGEADVMIAGGSDSTSNAEVKLPQKAVQALAPLAFGKAKGMREMLGVLSQLMPITELLPKMPKIAERATGEVMGESAESMARRNEVSRETQDAYALRSHQRAAAAIESGRFDAEVVPVTTPEGTVVHTDDIVRGDTSVEKLARLRPAFAADGTVTAGNASPLTDGASAVLLMSEEKAEELGYEPLAYFKSWAYVGVDPADQLLIGPALAMPLALKRAGYELDAMDLVDVHEAFAAQVLSVTKALESDAFGRQRLGRSDRVGTIDWDRFNVHGGSISIGHPFGATGARMVTTMANELKLRNAKTALLGICAAGGLGAAAVLERP